jgi:hypothetical protein
VVTVSGITPEEGYEFGEITQTGIVSGVTIDQAGKTVTYAKDVAGTSTINVTFTPKPTYAVRFFNNGEQVGITQNLYEGQSAVKPSDPSACEGYTFVGWWTAALAIDNTTAETWVTDFTVTGAQDYYAVYSHTEGGGGSSSGTKTFSFSSIARQTRSTAFCISQKALGCIKVISKGFKNSRFASSDLIPLTSSNLSNIEDLESAPRLNPLSPPTIHSFLQDMFVLSVFQLLF